MDRIGMGGVARLRGYVCVLGIVDVPIRDGGVAVATGFSGRLMLDTPAGSIPAATKRAAPLASAH